MLQALGVEALPTLDVDCCSPRAAWRGILDHYRGSANVMVGELLESAAGALAELFVLYSTADADRTLARVFLLFCDDVAALANPRLFTPGHPVLRRAEPLARARLGAGITRSRCCGCWLRR